MVIFSIFVYNKSMENGNNVLEGQGDNVNAPVVNGADGINGSVGANGFGGANGLAGPIGAAGATPAGGAGAAEAKPENVESGEKKQSSKLKIWLGVACGVLVVAMVVMAVMLSMSNGDGSGDNGGSSSGNSGSGSTVADDEDSDEDEIGAVDNSELASGSVTTTIDGRTITYKAAYVVDGVEATIGSGVYESISDDEVTFLVINGGSLTIRGEVEIYKTGSSDFNGRGDEYSFYGTNSAIVVVGEGSSASIIGATITTDVSGANAVVATNGGTVNIGQSTIETFMDNSRGLHATYGGVINADKATINTRGGSSASLATDRGEGTVTAKEMTLATAGAGSPLIYSTGAITVYNSTGTATGAQIAVVEGKNSVVLDGCDFTANGNGNRNGVDNAGVMIYQSMSGDAGVGVGSFAAKDSTLTVAADSSVYNETPFFFVTNTEAEVKLTDVTVDFSDAAAFVAALGTSEWGQSGANGGQATFTVSGLTATNTNVEVDEISSVSGL